MTVQIGPTGVLVDEPGEGLAEPYQGNQELFFEEQTQRLVLEDSLPAATLAAASSTIWIIRIFKHFLGSQREFSQTYEAISDAAQPMSNLFGLMSALFNFEINIHLPQVEFLRGTVSTWTPDGKPYNPWSFDTIDLEGVGQRVKEGDPQLMDLCCNIVKDAGTGRNGKAAYRGVLTEADVVAPAGQPAPYLASGPGSLRALIQDAADAWLTPYLGPTGSVAKIGLIDKTGQQRRPVIDWHFGGISVNKSNKKYFDRAPVG